MYTSLHVISKMINCSAAQIQLSVTANHDIDKRSVVDDSARFVHFIFILPRSSCTLSDYRH